MDLVAQVPAFQAVPSKIKHLLADGSSVLTRPAQHVFYKQGDLLTGMFVLASGHVKLYRESENRSQILALLRRGDCFATEALSDRSLSSYSAATITETAVLFIPIPVMRTLIDDYPEFRTVLLQLVMDRLRQFASLVHNLAFRDVSSRLALVLVARASEDGIQTAEGIVFPRLMTQGELATMVGTGREVVQRTFKKFSQANLVQVSRKEIVILDIDKLREIAEEETR